MLENKFLFSQHGVYITIENISVAVPRRFKRAQTKPKIAGVVKINVVALLKNFFCQRRKSKEQPRKGKLTELKMKKKKKRHMPIEQTNENEGCCKYEMMRW